MLFVFTVLLTNPLAMSSCALCGVSEADASLLKCSSCRSCCYCSQKCQQQDWETHKQICKILKAFRTLLNKSSDLKSRKGVLENGKDILRSPMAFSVVMNCEELDLLTLIVEDIQVYSAANNMIGTVYQPTFWTFSLLNSVFRGPAPPDAFSRPGSYNTLNLDYLMRFLQKPRPPESMDPWCAIMQAIIVQMRFIFGTQFMGVAYVEQVAKPMMRVFSCLVVHTKVCDFIFGNGTRAHETARAMNTLLHLIQDQDARGGDPESALEGLLFQGIAMLDLHAQKRDMKLAKEFLRKVGIPPDMVMMYNICAIPYATMEMGKYDVHN